MDQIRQHLSPRSPAVSKAPARSSRSCRHRRLRHGLRSGQRPEGVLALEATLSGLAFAGLAQMVALEGWTDHWSPATLLALGFLTFIVNMRHLPMAAAMRPCGWRRCRPGRSIRP